MSADHFDRKELSHDPLQDAFYAAVDYVYQRRRPFILGAVTVAVVAGAAASWFAYARYTERQDSEALFKADRALHDPAATEDVRLRKGTEAYQLFVEQRPGSELAPVAWLTLARLAWDQQQWDKAGAAFQQVIDRKAPPLLRTEALLGLGKVKEQQGKLAEAKALYEQIGDDFAAVKHLALGRAALAAGDAKAAREHFLQASAAQGGSSVSSQAREALDFLP